MAGAKAGAHNSDKCNLCRGCMLMEVASLEGPGHPYTFMFAGECKSSTWEYR